MKRYREKVKWLIVLLILIVIWRFFFVQIKFKSIDGKYKIVEISKELFMWEYDYYYIITNSFGFPLYTLNGNSEFGPVQLMEAVSYNDSTIFYINMSESGRIKLKISNQGKVKVYYRFDCNQTNNEIINYYKSFLKGKWSRKKSINDTIEFNDTAIFLNSKTYQLHYSFHNKSKTESDYFGDSANNIIPNIHICNLDQSCEETYRDVKLEDKNHILIWSRKDGKYIKYVRIDKKKS